MSAPRRGWSSSPAWRSALSCSVRTCWATLCAICSTRGNAAERRRSPGSTFCSWRLTRLATATESPEPGAGVRRLPRGNAEVVLDVEGLQSYLFTRLGVVKAVDDVSFAVHAA